MNASRAAAEGERVDQDYAAPIETETQLSDEQLNVATQAWFKSHGVEGESENDILNATIKALIPLIKGLFLIPGYSPEQETNQDYILKAVNVLLVDSDRKVSWSPDAPISEVASQLEIDGPDHPDNPEIFQLLTTRLGRLLSATNKLRITSFL